MLFIASPPASVRTIPVVNVYRCPLCSATVPPTPAHNAGPVSISQEITRTNVFANVSMNLLLLKLTGEIGQVSGGTINTFNSFSGKQAADSRIYGSVGARFGF